MGLDLTAITKGQTEGLARAQFQQNGHPDDLALAASLLRDEFDLRMEIQKGRMWLQDLWFLTYLIVDASQDNHEDLERPRYYTSKAMSIVDTARRVLAKNPVRYHLIEPHTGITREEREDSRVMENVYHGLMYDIDRQMIRRGEGNARMVAAFHSLVRGQWAYKLHLTSGGKTSTGSPAHYQALDPRLVLPAHDMRGMKSSINYNLVTLSQLFDEFDSIVRPLVDSIVKSSGAFTGKRDYSFLHVPLLKIEWATRDEHAVLLDIAGLPQEFRKNLGVETDVHSARRYVWLRKPWRHGFDESMVQLGNVNGVPAGIASTEAMTMYNQFTSGGRNLTPVASGAPNVTVTGRNVGVPPMMPTSTNYNSMSSSIDPAGAMMGRSLLAPVAHLFPAFNDLMVLLQQGVQNEIRGTWTFKSRGASMPTLSLGKGEVNALNLNESLENIGPNIRAIDVVQVMQTVQQDINEGSLDLRFVLGSDFEGSGFLRQRMEAGALTSLADYELGLGNWAVSLGETFNAQYRKGADSLKGWKLYGRQPGAATEYFVIDIDDQVKDKLTNTEEPVVIEAKAKVDVPIDFAARLNMAKTAVDPNNPIMSLVQAIDLILELDDADQAYDMILRDIGHRNPQIQLVKIADSFRRAGAPEVADMILGDQFRDAFSNAQAQGSTLTNSGAAKGTDPSAAPVEVTTGDGAAGTGRQQGSI